jgi:tRNA (cytidine/uridine-2'-O-)-methyltransferase
MALSVPKNLPDIVLLSPAIAQNTGAIARTCAGFNKKLHLIEPLGFELTDKGLRRSGLDYWPYAHMCIHENFEQFIEMQQVQLEQLLFLSTKGRRSLSDIQTDSHLIQYVIFGREDAGLPKAYYKKYENQLVVIPFDEKAIRSHNLAVSVGITLGYFLK